MKRCYKTKS